MLLAIDIGNTNVVFGVFRGRDLDFALRADTTVPKTPDEWAVFLDRAFAMRGLSHGDIHQVVVCSVVPRVANAINNTCKNYLGITPMEVGPGMKTGMPVLYENPKDVGADRVVNAVAVTRFYGKPAIVVDFGTAVTFDAINSRGEYLGGAILPGILVGAQALFSHTSKLPMVGLSSPASVIGRNTISSIQAGLYYGYAAMVQGMVARFRAELGQDAKVVATGGQAGLICKECPCVDAIDPDLTLRGLQYLAELN